MNSRPQNDSTVTYRPDIDGLRAIAVTAVVLNHVGLSCPGGFIGVDVFFVISGYLITSLILRDLDSGQFRTAEFYERRVRRILPALIVSVTAIFATAWVLYLPWDLERLGPAMMSQAVAMSNVVHWNISGYFAPDADTLPLLHTWSLAVEEQFYVLFPLFLWLIYKWRKSYVTPLLISGCLLSFAACVWATKRSPSASFYLLPTRSWELLIGSILATSTNTRILEHRWLREVVSCSGLIAIAWSIIAYDSGTPFPGIAAALPTLGAMAIIGANEQSQTFVGRTLSWSPFVFVGKISYSLYLVHWPLIVFTKYTLVRELTTLERVTVAALSFVMAVISWLVIETPLRQKRILGRRGPLFSVAAMAMIAIAAIGLWIQKTAGQPSRFTTEQLVYISKPNLKIGFDFEQVEESDVSRGRLIEFGAESETITCLVWGDSHALCLMPCITKVCQEKGIRGAAAIHVSTPPLVDFVRTRKNAVKDLPQYNAAILKYALDHKVRYAILAGFWKTHASHPMFQTCLKKTVDQLTSAGIKVIIVRDVAEQSGDVPRLLTHSLLLGQDVRKIGVPLEQHRKIQALADLAFAQLPRENLTVVDPIPYLIDENELCRAEMDGVSLYKDDDHLSTAGALRLRPMFEQALSE